MTVPTLLTPYGYSASTCGYCSPAGQRSAGPSSRKYGMEAPQMSCQFYQTMIDRGWRRSGDYMYHPDMARSCCPQYTIRLDVSAFKAGKKERQVVNRWNRFLGEGSKPGQGGGSQSQPRAARGVGMPDEHKLMQGKGQGNGQGNGQGKEKGKGKGKGQDRDKGKGKEAVDVLDQVKMYEVRQGGSLGVHRFETQLVPAKATDATYALYKRYQVAVHSDPPDKVTMRGFSRFLCQSPLAETPIKYRHGMDTAALPTAYGSYHMLYKVDGALIGISVIDILPACVSSVYFIWDPDWAWASLGRLSALREAALVRDMHRAGAEGMGWLYMGYWIPDCVKMKYKSEYGPSYLLDPGTNVFHPLDTKLETFLQDHPRGYTPFAEVVARQSDRPGSADVAGSTTETIGNKVGEEDADEDDPSEGSEVEELDAFPSSPPPPGFADPASFSAQDIGGLLVLRQNGRRGSGLVKVDDLKAANSEAFNRQIRELVAAVGMGMMAKSGTGLEEVKDKGILFFG